MTKPLDQDILQTYPEGRKFKVWYDADCQSIRVVMLAPKLSVLEARDLMKQIENSLLEEAEAKRPQH